MRLLTPKKKNRKEKNLVKLTDAKCALNVQLNIMYAGLFPHMRKGTAERGHTHILQPGNILLPMMAQGNAVEVQLGNVHHMVQEAAAKVQVMAVLQLGLVLVVQVAAEAGALLPQSI